MIEVHLKISPQMNEAIKLLQDIGDNAPDLLSEVAFKELLQIIEGGKFICIDHIDPPAPGTSITIQFLKFSDEFMGCVSTLGALYRQRGFVVPVSFDERHVNTVLSSVIPPGGKA